MSTEPTKLMDLPNELLFTIFSKCTYGEVDKISQLNERCKEIVTNKHFQRVHDDNMKHVRYCIEGAACVGGGNTHDNPKMKFAYTGSTSNIENVLIGFGDEHMFRGCLEMVWPQGLEYICVKCFKRAFNTGTFWRRLEEIHSALEQDDRYDMMKDMDMLPSSDDDYNY